MATRRVRPSDPLARFRTLAPVPNQMHADQRLFTDRDFFDSLEPACKPLRGVREALACDDIAAARAAVLRHFRSRSRPRVTPYHTDPHASDWGDVTVRARANALAGNRCYEDEHTLIDLGGGLAEHGGIDWPRALKLNHEIRRQGAMVTLAHAWTLAQDPQEKQRHAATLQRWLRSYWTAVPFVLVPDFHREAFADLGGPAHQQLGTAYVLFNWTAVLDSPLFRTPGALPDDFAFEFLKQLRFRAFQFTRLLGASWRADNHHLMERGVATYFLGVQFAEFRRAGEMTEYGRQIIIRHFDHNVLPDNVGAEHCAAYNYRCFVRYALPLSVARANGRSLLGARREKRLKEWLEHHAWLCAPDGRLVDTGDGAAPSLYRIAEESGAMLASRTIKGVLASLGQAGPVNPAFQAGWDRLKPSLPRETSRIYPFAGHMVMRDGWRPDSMFLHMAIKNQSLYNIHTHWNIYEFTLAAFGRRLIGNPAARTYGLPRGDTRGFYFSMDAHNTLVTDDDNLKSHRALAKQWGLQPPRIASARTCLNTSAGIDYATFTHRGYLPLVHRRDVLFVRGRYVIMTDGITMDFRGLNAVFSEQGDIRPHTYRQRIHFETGVAACRGPQDSVVAGEPTTGAGVLIVPEPFENLQTNVGPNEYMQALDHPGFRDYAMADITRGTIGPCFFSTVYRPFNGHAAPPVTVTPLTPPAGPYRDDHYHAIRIDDGARCDVWFVQRDLDRPRRRRIEADGLTLETDAACLFVSTEAGRPVQTWQAGGTRSVLNDRTLAARPGRLTREIG